MIETEQKQLESLIQQTYEGQLSNKFWLEVIQFGFDILNLETISDHAKRTGKSYNGSRKFKQIKEFGKVKFCYDNE